MKKDHVISSEDNVYLYDNDIVMWKESPEPTARKVEVLGMKLKHILDLTDHSSFYIVFDLRKVKIPPDAEARASLKKTFNDSRSKLLHGCVIVHNAFMKITAKLVIKSYFKSISYHTKIDEALNKIKLLRDT